MFDLQWVTADEKRNTGGKRISEKNLVLCGSQHSDKMNGTFTARNPTKKLSHPVTIHWDLIEKINNIEVI